MLCFLPDAEEFLREKEDVTKVLDLFREYLMDVPSKVAMAAWMTGHALGGHWHSEDTVPILIDAARKARFAAGRGATVTGLGERLSLVSPDRRKFILRELRHRAKADRSEGVRTAARVTLMLASKRESDAVRIARRPVRQTRSSRVAAGLR